MDYNQLDSNQISSQAPRTNKCSGFAIASLCCGIASLLCCCVGIGLPLAALAIIFAILNRRKGKDTDAMTIVGLVTGAIGLVLGLAINLASWVLYEDPSFQQEMYDSFEEAYGEEYADVFAEFYGLDPENLK